MRLTPRHAWTIARVLSGLEVNGELQELPEPFGTVGRRLDDLPLEACQYTWQGFLDARDDRAEIIDSLSNVDPEGPRPEDDPNRRPANLADLRRAMSESQWHWSSWIATARIGGIAASEGVGKTRFAMDLSRRLWFGEPWPDNQAPTFPERTPTLWACSDGQQDDLYAIAEAWKMPPESLSFLAFPEDVYAGIDLDDPETLPRLEDFIGQVRPGLVFIDSLTFATNRDLCQANHVMSLMTPIRDLSQRTQTSIIPLLHVSRDGQALGKRIKGICRTILHLECPDPDKPARLRLSVFKSFAKKPPPLGVTMTDDGNLYDSDPPEAAGKGKGKPGRPSAERDDAMQFIRDSLAQANGQAGIDLRDEWHEVACRKAREAGKAEPNDTDKTFNRAKKAMIDAGELAERGGTGKGERWTLHLIRADPAADF